MNLKCLQQFKQARHKLKRKTCHNLYYHVVAAEDKERMSRHGLVRKGGHRSVLVFWWAQGRVLPNSLCQTGDPRQVMEPVMKA